MQVGMVRLAVVVCGLFVGACGGLDPATKVGPNENVQFDNGVNGSVSCDRGSVNLPSGATINGDLDLSYCVVKVEGSVNGSITMTGGILYVISSPTVNGELDVKDGYELEVIDSQFNGGADVENTRNVTIENSDFNGDIQIHGAETCQAGGNRANGSIVAANCN